MRISTTTSARLALLAAAVALVACSGDDDDVPPMAVDPLAAVPDSATASAAGLTEYLMVLAGLPSDSREPLAVSHLSLPASDADEPLPLR